MVGISRRIRICDWERNGNPNPYLSSPAGVSSEQTRIRMRTLINDAAGMKRRRRAANESYDDAWDQDENSRTSPPGRDDPIDLLLVWLRSICP